MKHETVVLRLRQKALEGARSGVESEDLDPKSFPIPNPSEQQRDEAAICYADFLLCVILNPGNVQGCREDYCKCFDGIFGT